MAQHLEWQKLNRPYTTPDPTAWTNYQREIYGSLSGPIFSTKPAEWEALAKAKVPAANFGYVHGAASSNKTREFNIQAFDRYRLRPSMLVDVTQRDMSVELFGQRHPGPLLVAPVGVQEIMHKDAEEATARACASLKVPMVLSTAATRSIEEVAAANGPDGARWYQLYWPRPQAESVTASLLARAKANGFKVLVVTLDTFNLAWRPTDLDTAYLPFVYGQGCQVGFSDPEFQRTYAQKLKTESTGAGAQLGELWSVMMRSGSPLTAAKVLYSARTMHRARVWMDIANSGTFRTWDQLETLKQLWDGPIVLKGIQTVEDAHRAIEYGMDGIIVSNHGGRQVDGAIASLDALAEIGADERVRASGLTLLFDSGIRTGSDVLKALALGAKAVLIGRPYMYGLAIAGERGVRHVLRCILADADNMLGNIGRKSLQDLSRKDLQILGTPTY